MNHELRVLRDEWEKLEKRYPDFGIGILAGKAVVVDEDEEGPVLAFQSLTTRTVKTLRDHRVKVPAKKAAVIRFNDIELPADAVSWVFFVVRQVQPFMVAEGQLISDSRPRRERNVLSPDPSKRVYSDHDKERSAIKVIRNFFGLCADVMNGVIARWAMGSKANKVENLAIAFLYADARNNCLLSKAAVAKEIGCSAAELSPSRAPLFHETRTELQRKLRSNTKSGRQIHKKGKGRRKARHYSKA
jgi:hypothetical protein